MVMNNNKKSINSYLEHIFRIIIFEVAARAAPLCFKDSNILKVQNIFIVQSYRAHSSNINQVQLYAKSTEDSIVVKKTTQSPGVNFSFFIVHYRGVRYFSATFDFLKLAAAITFLFMLAGGFIGAVFSNTAFFDGSVLESHSFLRRFDFFEARYFL